MPAKAGIFPPDMAGREKGWRIRERAGVLKDCPDAAAILALIGPDGILPVKAVPGARVERAAVVNGALKIWLRTPPEDGKANKALLKLIARMLDVPVGSLELVSGATGRVKQINVKN